LALPVIVFTSGGSDSQASGSGGTAVFGTAAATHSNTSVGITDGGVDLSGVSLTGSAALWVSSSSGRQWSKITNITGSIGNWTVTVQSAYANTESGRTWAIGGSRLTLANSTQLGADILAGWTLDVQNNQTITAAYHVNASNNAAGTTTTVTCSQVSRAVITQTTNNTIALDIAGSINLLVSNLSFKGANSGATGGGGYGIGLGSASGANDVIISNCLIDTFNQGIAGQDSGGNVGINRFAVVGTEIKNCSQNGVRCTLAQVHLRDCYIHGNGTVSQSSAGNVNMQQGGTLERSIFDSSVNGDNVSIAGQGGNVPCSVARNCDFTNAAAGGNGLVLNDNGGNKTFVVEDCIFYGNAAFGLKNSGSIGPVLVTNNAYGANTSGATSGVTDTNPLTLTANPFTSSSDFSLNSTAGGGVVCKGAATSIPNGTAITNVLDVGAVQTGTPAPTVGAGALIYPSSVYPADTSGRIALSYYVGTGGNASPADEWLWVKANLDADATFELRFPMPPTIPSGTFKLRILSLAAASSGVAKFTVSDGRCPAFSSPSAATLNVEPQSTVTWAAGNADQYLETKIALTTVPQWNDMIVLAIKFQTSGWTLAQSSVWVPSVLWE
jgi:hypothetical protein